MASPPEFYATAEPESPKTAMTKKTQQFQMLKVFIIALIAALTAIFIIMDVVQTAKQYSKKRTLRQKIKYSLETASAIHNLQRERGMSSLFLVLESWNTKNHRQDIGKIRNDTDKSVHGLSDWKVIHINGTKIENRASFLSFLQSYREKAEIPGKIVLPDLLNTYSYFINEMMSWLSQYAAAENLENYAEDVYAYQMIVHSKEEAGLERVLGSLYFLQGTNFSHVNLLWYNEKRIRSETFLETAFGLSHEMKDTYASLIANSSWINEIAMKRKLLASADLNSPSEKTAREWFFLMSKYNDLMFELQEKDANRINEHVDDTMTTSMQWLVIRSFLLSFALFGVPSIIISLIRVQNAFYQYTLSLYDKVGLEQGRTEFLMRENARHVENLASRWKSFAKDSNPPSNTGSHQQISVGQNSNNVKPNDAISR